MLPSIHDLTQRFELQPHPEGGYFKETYRAQGKTQTPHGTRNYSTAIYYLLPRGAKSKLHRITSDELWHFYLGGPLQIVEITPQGNLTVTTLGSNLLKGEQLQYTVPAGNYFGAIPKPDTPYSFVGCTVAPGFEFADFEMGNKTNLLQMFPEAKTWIEALT